MTSISLQTSHCNIFQNSTVDLTLDCNNWLSPSSMSFDLTAFTDAANILDNDYLITPRWGHTMVLLVEALCYKLKGRRFNSQ
jgi:hypothetical protein